MFLYLFCYCSSSGLYMYPWTLSLRDEEQPLKLLIRVELVQKSCRFRPSWLRVFGTSFAYKMRHGPTCFWYKFCVQKYTLVSTFYYYFSCTNNDHAPMVHRMCHDITFVYNVFLTCPKYTVWNINMDQKVTLVSTFYKYFSCTYNEYAAHAESHS